MRVLEIGLTRRAVIEAYVTHDFQKKQADRPLPDFDTWDWSTANAIDDHLRLANLKPGILAGYVSWDLIEIDISDLRECAVVSSVFSEQPHRQLRAIEMNGG